LTVLTICFIYSTK